MAEYCRFVKLLFLFPGISIKGCLVLLKEPVAANLTARCLSFPWQGLACPRGEYISVSLVWEIEFLQ